MARILVVDDDALVRRKVRDSLTAAGHEVFLALDGAKGLVALKEHHPDLVLVDYIMPGLNGFQFCAAMTALPAFRTVPAVLMSARTDRVGWRFIERFGVRDALHKPLNYDLLPTVVANVLRQVTKRGIWDGLGEGSVRSDYPIRDAFLVPEQSSDSQARTTDQHHAIAMSGRIDAIAVSEVLQLLALQQRTGILHVLQGDRAAAIQIRQGGVVLALAEGFGDEYRIGRFAVGRRLVSRRDLEILIESTRASGLLGGQLVSLGHISSSQLCEILAEQTREIVYETIGWEEGEFRFVPDRELSQSRKIENPLNIHSLLMDGAKQNDDWKLMSYSIPSLDVVFVSNETAESNGDLESSERSILSRIDGVRTVRVIADDLSLLPFEVCRALHRFVRERRIIRMR